MKNAISFVQAAYNIVREYAPAATPRKRRDGSDSTLVSPPIRFLQDIGSWAIFTLMPRLTKQVLRTSPADERDYLALAALVVPAHRASPGGWLEDQLQRTFDRLSTPSVREAKLSEAEAAMLAKLSPETLKRRNEIKARMGSKGAAAVIKAWDGAETTARAYIASAGAHTGATTEAVLSNQLLTALVNKVRDSICDSSAFYSAMDDVTTAVLCEAIVESGEYLDLIAEWEPAAPTDLADGGGWTSPFEGMSAEGMQDAADEDRRAMEEAERAEIKARTGTDD